MPPKGDRLFATVDGGTTLYELTAPPRIPLDYGRGRRVAWVDVDADGTPELSVSNKGSANKLLRRLGDGTYTDVAPALGVDLAAAEVQCWGDFDGDGLDDLFYVDGQVVHLLRNDGEEFEPRDGATLGLTFGPSQPVTSLFNFAALRLADFDNDGDLDLWLLMQGEDRRNFLFRRDGDHFTDVTEEAGVSAVHGNIFTVLFDADNDGTEDAVSSGLLAGDDPAPGAPIRHALLWNNRGGRFAMRFLDPAVLPKAIHCATDLDVDRDGRVDLAAIGTDRVLLRNTTNSANRWVRVEAHDRGRPALGAVVRVHYDDGSVCARRVGSAHNTAYSQVIRPLHFGVPAGQGIRSLSVQWPGDASPTTYDPPPLGAVTVVPRAR